MATAQTGSKPERWQDSRFWRAAALLLPWVFASRFADAIRWVRAGDLSAQRRFEEALRVARSMRAQFKQDMEWKVFEIQQLVLLQWDLETIDAANHFLLEYEYPTAKSDDWKYLLAYVKWCGASAFARYATESPTPSAFEFDASKIFCRVCAPTTNVCTR
jgi:hypothetical protein